MNTLADFIDRLEAEPYYFVGSYWTADVLAPHPLPFEFDCEITHNDERIAAEGTYRAHSGMPQHPFRLTLPFNAVKPHVVSAQLECPQLGSLSGTLMFVSGAATLLMHSNSAIVSGHLTLDDRVISLVGTLDCQGKQYGYSLKGAVSSYRATLSNVVGIRSHRG